MRFKLFIALCATFTLTAGTVDAADVLVQIDNMHPDEIQAVGFQIDKPISIEIDAQGIRTNYNSDLIAYAWILDYETREPVWVMKNRGRGRSTRGEEVRVETSQRLEPGKYELYMCAMDRWSGNWDNSNIDNLGDLFRVLRDAFSNRRDRGDRDYGYDPQDCYVRISSDDIRPSELKTFEVDGKLPDALIRHTRLANDEYIKDGFKLSQPGTIHIYAVVEFPDGYDSPVDGGWIVNADTRERVWQIDRWNADYGGGGDKNKVVNEDVKLDAGNYVLYFATDDSHSYAWFNVNPPWDPLNWGITITPGKGFNKASFSSYEPPGPGDALVDLTRVRDDDYVEQAFKLNRESDVLIRCLGEYSDGSDEFVDYGAIQDLATGDIVWEMTYRNTDHAGGGTKNRMFDKPITLPAGRYLAFYSTDGSHSYRDWNTSPPYDPEAWGLAIYPAKKYTKGSLTKIDADQMYTGSDVLVRIDRVRDDADLRKSFTLDKESKVHVHALGEGSDGRMYDYGWIEDARTGRTVWEMRYRRTRHAGGASKNRQADQTITLDKGEYDVFYVSDGSHSYNDWNASRPHNPNDWGITVTKSE